MWSNSNEFNCLSSVVQDQISRVPWMPIALHAGHAGHAGHVVLLIYKWIGRGPLKIRWATVIQWDSNGLCRLCNAQGPQKSRGPQQSEGSPTIWWAPSIWGASSRQFEVPQQSEGPQQSERPLAIWGAFGNMKGPRQSEGPHQSEGPLAIWGVTGSLQSEGPQQSEGLSQFERPLDDYIMLCHLQSVMSVLPPHVVADTRTFIFKIEGHQKLYEVPCQKSGWATWQCG